MQKTVEAILSFSSGTFSINSSGQPVVTGTVISSTAFNSLTADLATGLSTCVLKDGTQTLTANIPMGSFKLTGLGAGSAAGNSVRWEQSCAGILTTTGDTPYASAANTVSRIAASADVAANATTSNIWGAREITLTGGAVTFTDIADAPYAGAVAWVKQNASHTWTNGAVFDVQGNVSYTAAAGDLIRVYATTVSTFEITIFRSASEAQGTFTISLTGCTAAITTTAVYSVTNNAATLYFPALEGTSNTTSCTATGLPAVITPASGHLGLWAVTKDNGAAGYSRIDVNADSTITVYVPNSVTASGGAFTASGTKGLPVGGTWVYNLN